MINFKYTENKRTQEIKVSEGNHYVSLYNKNKKTSWFPATIDSRDLEKFNSNVGN